MVGLVEEKSEINEISDIKLYNRQMSASMADKMFFLDILKLVPDNYEIIHLEEYPLDWTKNNIKETFGYDIKDNTHIKLLLIHKDIYDEMIYDEFYHKQLNDEQYFNLIEELHYK